jgi:hypothetical protein
MKDNANRTVGWEEKRHPLIIKTTYLGGIKNFHSSCRQGMMLLTRLPGKEGSVNRHQMNVDNSNATHTTKRTHKTLLKSRQEKITGVTLKEREGRPGS